MPTLQKFSEITLLEKLVLDPSEVATSRTELQLHSGSIRIVEQGVDWGDAEIAAFMAERERGEAPVDFRIPNRKVTIPLEVGTTNSTTINTARASLQAKVALLQREGGWLKRETTDGRKFYLDVVNATLNMPEHYAHLGYELDVVLTLECIPDLYGAEVILSAHTESTNPELIFTETGITGDYPGRVRIFVEELQGVDQLGLLWGVRSRHYSSAATAALAFAATTLDPLDSASVVSGAIEHGNLGTGWTPVVGTNLGGTTFLTHTGSYRVWATVESDDGDAVRARFVWDVGDLTLPAENTPATVPGTSTSYMLDLGEIRLDPAPIGTHRWQGQIQAQGAVGGEELRVSRLDFQPLDEGAGRLSASANTVEGLADYAARDEFNQVAGNLNGVTAPVGGNWATSGGAVDFAIEATGHTAEISTASQTRLGVLGAAATDVVAQADVKASVVGSPASGTKIYGVVLRYVDASNYVFAGYQVSSGFIFSPKVVITKRVAGVQSTLAVAGMSGVVAANDFFTVRVQIKADGSFRVWCFPQGGSPGASLLSGTDSVLATAGALASGKSGLYDSQPAGSVTRNYKNFAAGGLALDAVLFASRSAELRTDGMFRYSADGLGPGPVAHVLGDLPRLPPAGLEGRTVQVFLKASRGDFDRLPDTNTDDLRATVKYRPSWLMIAS